MYQFFQARDVEVEADAAGQIDQGLQHVAIFDALLDDFDATSAK